MLYDPILSEIIDSNGKITDATRDSIVSQIKNILVNGTNSLPTLLSTLVSDQEKFEGITEYEQIDLKNKEEFPQLHNEIIDVLFAGILNPLKDLTGQTPIPLIFDPSGLIPPIPDLPSLPDLPIENIPPTLLETLNNILQIDQNLILSTINQFLISQSPPLPQIDLLTLQNIINERKDKRDLLISFGFQLPPPPINTDVLDEVFENLFKDFKGIFTQIIKDKIDTLIAAAGQEIKIKVKNTLEKALELKIPALPPLPTIITSPRDILEPLLQPLIENINSIYKNISIPNINLQELVINETTKILSDKINKYINIFKLPVDTVIDIIKKLFTQILGGQFNPIGLIIAIINSIKITISELITPVLPVIPIQIGNNALKLTLNTATIIVLIKFLLESIMKIIVGSILGKGKIADALALALFPP